MFFDIAVAFVEVYGEVHLLDHNVAWSRRPRGSMLVRTLMVPAARSAGIGTCEIHVAHYDQTCRHGKVGAMQEVTEAHVAALKKVPLFAELAHEQICRIALSAQESNAPSGTVLVREGEDGDTFFLILSGSARVDRDGQVVARLGPNQFVGEMSLLDGKPRAATVEMDSDGVVLTVCKDDFAALLRATEFRETLFGVLCDRVRTLQVPRFNDDGGTPLPVTLDSLYASGEVYDAIDACEAVIQALHRLARHHHLTPDTLRASEDNLRSVRTRLEQCLPAESSANAAS